MTPANHDLRAWLNEVEKIGQLHRIEGIPWNKDMGGLVEMILERSKHAPAMLFEKIPDARQDMRVLCSQIDGIERLALAMGTDPKVGITEFIQAWRRKVRNFQPLEPQYVKDAPIFENRVEKDIDLEAFPIPRWHELDGGRYIGTDDLVITRDPEEDWVNAGTYRVMLQGKDAVALYISPGKHGGLHRKKYFDMGKPCPRAVPEHRRSAARGVAQGSRRGCIESRSLSSEPAMSIKSDRWIRRMATEHAMIEPFEAGQVRHAADGHRIVSYGTSSYGYDIRCAREFKVFTNIFSTVVDPKNFDERSFVDIEADVCVIPPNSFALARTMEYFRIPRNVLTICLGKSTYARCGIIVNVTPFEPEWEGFVTLEFSNTTPLPAKIYAGEGCAQVLFFESDEVCETSYKDRGGKYQGQRGVTLPKA